jgi:hypothetical protein
VRWRAEGADYIGRLVAAQGIFTRRRPHPHLPDGVPPGPQSRRREVGGAVAYEDWRPVQPLAGSQAFRFGVPERAPFSHEGDCLSFAWMVRAREPRAGARDPHQDEPLWVVP